MKELIKKFEGLRLKTYKCPAGIRTIGYGHTGNDVVFDLEISEEEAERLLEKDIDNLQKELLKILPYELSENQFNALISFVFNIGINAFLKSTLFKKIKNKELDQVPFQMRRWVYSNKKILEGLKKRRESEIALWLS